MKRLLPLAFIEVSVWVALLLCAVAVSKVAFALSLGTTSLERLLTAILRLGLSAGVILAWLLAWKKVTDAYFWRTIARGKTNA
jgi:hypothetical protein